MTRHLLGPWAPAGHQDNLNLPALLVSFAGTAILLALVKLLRRGSVR